MSKYGAAAELNPVAQQIAKDTSPTGGTVFLALQNLAILFATIITGSSHFLAALLGAKLALVACQLKSLQLELFIDKIFAARNAK